MIKVVKVQRPITPPNSAWLIYDKEHSHVVMWPADEVDQFVKDEMGRDMKAYFNAQWRNGEWDIMQRVREQDW